MVLLPRDGFPGQKDTRTPVRPSGFALVALFFFGFTVFGDPRTFFYKHYTPCWPSVRKILSLRART